MSEVCALDKYIDQPCNKLEHAPKGFFYDDEITNNTPEINNFSAGRQRATPSGSSTTCEL